MIPPISAASTSWGYPGLSFSRMPGILVSQAKRQRLPRPDRYRTVALFFVFSPKCRGTSASPSPCPHIWPLIFPGAPYALLSSHLFFLLVLLNLTQDIHSSPGPHPCSVCSLPVVRRGYSFLCSRCNAWTHKRCSGQRSINFYSEDWICPACRRSDPIPARPSFTSPLQPPPRLPGVLLSWSPPTSASSNSTAMGFSPAQLSWLLISLRTTWRLLVSKRPSYQLHPAPPPSSDTCWSAGTARK
jgi:hypothetical protein